MSEGKGNASLSAWAAGTTALVLLSVVVYVASYPFAYHARLRKEQNELQGLLGQKVLIVKSSIPYYQPVEWLIDNTLLKTPILMWAGVLSLRDEIHASYECRKSSSP